MHIRPNPISQHCFQRRVLWVRALLMWVLFALQFGCSAWQLQRRRHLVGGLGCRVAWLVTFRARQIAGIRYTRRLRRAHEQRAALGSRMRERLRHRDLATRMARLLDMVRNLDREAAIFAKRLKRGLTRYRSFKFETVDDAIAALVAFAPRLADSS